MATDIGNGNGSIPTSIATVATIASNAATMETNIGAEIFNQISVAHSGENIITSPLLVEALLSLLYLGSDGAAAEELARVLHLKRFASNAKMANYFAAQLALATQGADTKIQMNSRILLCENCAVAEEFQKIAHKYFQTTAENCNLQNAEKLRHHVNESIAKITTATAPATLTATTTTANNIVEALLTELSSSSLSSQATTAAILLLAANLESKWFLPFSAYRSGLYDFHAAAPAAGTVAEPQTVSMLFDDDMFVKFGEFRELDARAIELPYEHEDELAMLLVLPNQRDGLAVLEQQLGALNLSELTERMQMESVQVLVPKFSIDFACNLRPCLQELGLSCIFGQDANFKNLRADNSKDPLSIRDMLHRVTIAVTESGSEVANASVAHKPIVISNSLNSRQKFFRADHPFYFAIRNRDVTYFVGHVVKCF